MQCTFVLPSYSAVVRRFHNNTRQCYIPNARKMYARDRTVHLLAINSRVLNIWSQEVGHQSQIRKPQTFRCRSASCSFISSIRFCIMNCWSSRIRCVCPNNNGRREDVVVLPVLALRNEKHSNLYPDSLVSCSSPRQGTILRGHKSTPNKGIDKLLYINSEKIHPHLANKNKISEKVQVHEKNEAGQGRRS